MERNFEHDPKLDNFENRIPDCILHLSISGVSKDYLGPSNKKWCVHKAKNYLRDESKQFKYHRCLQVPPFPPIHNNLGCNTVVADRDLHN